MEPLILALDFGGTKLTAALTRQGSTEWVDIKRAFSHENGKKEDDLAVMFDLIDALTGQSNPKAAGVSFGGPVDFETGLVHLSHHVSGWENTPLQQLLEEKLGMPVVVENDANAAAIGEHQYGAGKGIAHLCYITVSTGVGSGWILDNRPWRGVSGMAGEIGHMVVDQNGPVCLCGKRGCVERLASGPFMAADYIKNTALKIDPKEVSGKFVAESAANGDQTALEILRRAAHGLGTGIGNAANLLNPQRFILGGGVTFSGAFWWQEVKSSAFKTAIPEIRDTFDIVPAKLDEDAPLWGAVFLAQQKLTRENRADG